MYFEEKRNWDAKMSEPLIATIISEPDVPKEVAETAVLTDRNRI